MIPNDKFPWKSHRSLAEVDETVRLLEKRRNVDKHDWYGRYASSSFRLSALLARAVECPPENDNGSAA